MNKEFVTIADLIKRYSISRTTFFRLRKHDSFPKSITPKECNPIWRLTDIENWEDNNKSAA